MMDGNNVLSSEEAESVKSEFEKQTLEAQEAAATMCALYMPKFQLAIAGLKNKGLRRVLNALIKYPLEEAPRFADNYEKNAFLIGNKLLEAKYMLIIGTLLASQEVNKKLEEVAEQASTNEETKGDETNV